VVPITHEQTIICSKTRLDGTTHEQIIICGQSFASHVVGCRPMEGKKKLHRMINGFIIYQTHYEKSDWPRTFIQFTIACELDMINALSAADIAFIMSSSTSAWLLSSLECSPQKQNG